MLQKKKRVIGVVCFVLMICITFGVYISLLKIDTSVAISSNHSKMLVIFTDKNLTTHYHLANPRQKVNVLLYKQQMTDYPSALWIEKKNIFLFTTKDANGDTQLFQLDLDTKKKTQLTNQFRYVDYLRLDQNQQKVYMRVLLPNHRNFHLATYDLNQHTSDVWNSSEKDRSMVYFDYNALQN
ncbi:hypothetical protein IC619_000395 [Hazenella sp. IB182353]|uniref:hypothetical protein n=1 Tax=Polycladospora coralii TaxID=2771432 RepID=UPI0017476274|nr:hypothetical protein [Polycladospora coralii]MBS7528950.1 hypothetical protein [Polycladospora coralii]